MLPLYDENRSLSTPLVTWILILVNGAVFFWEAVHGFDSELFLIFGEIPLRIAQGRQLYSLVTYMFLHSDPWHILGNMLYLFVFGDNVEDRFGPVRYLLLYLTFGVTGGLAHAITAVFSDGLSWLTPAIGASGAVSGVLGAYLAFFPRAKVFSLLPFYFVWIAPVPAWVFIGFWFILQLIYSSGVTSVAYMAHLGGFIMGFVVAKILSPRIKGYAAREGRGEAERLGVRAGYCAYCGFPLQEEADFCPICGEKRGGCPL